jgi:hypothetical protein
MMIINPTKSQLVEIIQHESGTCVSILFPTHTSGPQTTQNAIRFKNLIADAIEKVGAGDADLHRQLKRLRELEHEAEFWQHQERGLAIYVCGDFVQQLKLTEPVAERVYVADHFYVAPIAAAACASGGVRILALSWERARLFASDGQEVNEIKNETFPAAMDQLVTPRDPEEQLQFSSSSSPNRNTVAKAGATPMYHGHGEGEDKIEADRRQYLSRIGKRISDELYNSEQPLVLLATDEVAGHFQQITHVQAVDVIPGSPEGMDQETLRRECAAAAQSVLSQSNAAVQERLGTALANQAGSQDLEQIVRQSAAGRVDTLVVGDTQPRWGTFDRDDWQVTEDRDAKTDLINLAIRETLLAGGSVVEHSDGGANYQLAAIFRY